MALLLSNPSHAETELTLALNWAPGADHAPFYYAKQQGWYQSAGIRLNIEAGVGSANTVRKVARNQNVVGIADLLYVFLGPRDGDTTLAVLNVFANTPYSLYWLRSSNARTPRDLNNKRFGALSNEPARILFPAVAKLNGIATYTLSWVDVGAAAKMEALRNKSIDVAVNAFFYNHIAYQTIIGGDLVEMSWREAGVNPYSHSLVVNPALVARDAKLVQDLVQVSQRALAACLADAQPCLAAMLETQAQFDRRMLSVSWQRARELMLPAGDQAATLGAFDTARVRQDFALAQQYYNLPQSFDPMQVVSNRFLNPKTLVPAQSKAPQR